ncbi:hypothetical protein B5M10_05295 [Pluralibacter gergoviae]|uniref:glycosyltransferase n=1 Tax=Pluralibacter gergoviae TaxID=61647 RepID=UPI0009081A85|nr:glycosyltransferase [Pluralibacter gergoviae]ELG9929434.1 glycosyltransferase [Pluralibacter gergoviae]ELK5591837.1 glycosyltransferase [Pluralibacter gergoviae]MDU4434965.1 glycosyltransferase [Pluralibacter gergoviae]OUR03706.1 hypothetical protein B5M10_05295 [Pluralibacter gergoviae]PHH46717.1 glycosyl transferase family 2 [Pluralibacter gergoviae]
MILSIVIPCYNCSSNIFKLLDIIRQQVNEETKNKIEVILVNDGSSDNTEEILYSFVAKYNTFNSTIITTPNNGAAMARELGLKKATGRYVFFCDSDDLISRDFIDVFLKTYYKHDDFDILYFSSVQSMSGDVDSSNRSSKISFSTEGIEDEPSVFFNYLLNKGMWTAAVWTYIFRRELATIGNANFTNRAAHEDHLFTLKILFSSKKIIYTDAVLYMQMITEGSLTNSNKNTSYINDRYSAYKEASSYLIPRCDASTCEKYNNWSVSSILRLYKENNFALLNALLDLSFFRFFLNELNIIKSIIFKRHLR